ncbi:SDR family NAD(P)-dependent oxidoreductase [Sphingopyxis sp. 113P3]|jgi:Dehydrogenases with different specificities (related to short-chain alcohol dehydrogenases)|uniref:SDR family NAD(P)-dependent oxidoreductase n=1 Tax=Sphingopyxis sp. (strain 113P3) TaxID=292913 RepID=UPI0006AD3B91|nr:glucose 1-dehydrogenase [Sphingopyxis sp. 113P3]ALC10402.1 oxidoreductase [Sphingopyxis sp. 113P3]
MNLQGKTALVTGGGRDIGRSVSIALARAGARVAINYNSGREAAEETLAAIKAAGGEAFLIQADVTDSSAVRAMLDEVGIAFSGRLDILVNLAGGMVARKTLGEMDEAFFDQVMTLNLKSAFLVLKGALPFLGEGSAVVNVSSLAGRDGGGPGASVYATAKGAMMTWTRSMAKELGPQGIRVNAVCPGLIGTSFHDIFSKPEGRAATAGNTPLRREGHPDEVADSITYLASPAASFLTGVCLDINGGLAFS